MYGEGEYNVVRQVTRESEQRSILDEAHKHKQQSLNLLVGDILGEGAFRRVYEVRHDPSLVLKIDYDGSLSNAKEWMTWCALDGTPDAKWFAPCVAIDEFTGAMLQKRCRLLSDTEWEAHERRTLPKYLQDYSKRTNWGWYQEGDEPGRVVMVDYAMNLLIEDGARAGRPKKQAKKDKGPQS